MFVPKQKLFLSLMMVSAFAGRGLHAQADTTTRQLPPPMWQDSLPDKIVALKMTDLGTILVETKGGVMAIDPASGEHLWSRPDVSQHFLIDGTGLMTAMTASGRVMVDLATGTDRWSFSSLPIPGAQRLSYVQSGGFLLAHSSTKTAGAYSVVAASIDSGKILWKNDELYSTPELLQNAHKVSFMGRSDPIVDSSGTMILAPSGDGLLRLDVKTGRLLWRVPEDSLKRLKVSGVAGASMLQDGGAVYVPGGKRLIAVSVADGRILWSRDKDFKLPVSGMQVTHCGLLVHGRYAVNPKGIKSWKPYIALIDPSNGATLWTTDSTLGFQGRSEPMLRGDTVFVALKKGLALYDLETGKLLRTSELDGFKGGETPNSIEALDNGRLLLTSSQNLQMLDSAGNSIYQSYYRAPGQSGLLKFAMLALSVAGTVASYNVAGMIGSPTYSVFSPGPAVFARFKATENVRNFTYVYTDSTDIAANRAGFSLVKIAKETGKEVGRVWIDDRSPEYVLDPVEGVVVYKASNNTLVARRY